MIQLLQLRIKIILFFTIFFFTSGYSQIKVLFDATKAETAGNADWVIDSDLFNLSYSGGTVSIGGNEANPQQIPTPAQSGINASTPETYWKGALSSWGIDCVKQGYTVETLPYNGQITYGLSSNSQDLSRYKVFIVCEPNIVFTNAEKTAILNFVQNGGGLFMVSDHDVSDRNNDGWDSPHIWNDLLNNNSVMTNPFGITFDYANISGASFNIVTQATDSILHGPMGNVAEAEWFNGTTMSLNKAINPTATGKIFTTGSSITGTTNVMFATAFYGKGKVAAIGDSSPCEDGTGDTGDALYNGYWTDAADNHRPLLMNATIWLATTKPSETSLNPVNELSSEIQIENPVRNHEIKISFTTNKNAKVLIELIDITGKVLRTKLHINDLNDAQFETIKVDEINSGFYLLKISSDYNSITKLIIIPNK